MSKWIIALVAGGAYCLCLPPFNESLHNFFYFFPLYSFIALVPLLVFSLDSSFKSAVFRCLLFGFSASLGQYYWIGFVAPEGLWHLILLGTGLITMVMALLYLGLGLLYRWFYLRVPKIHILAFASAWVLIEYLRSIGEISFPWMLIGYALTPILPLAQLASLCGVFGISFLIVSINCIVAILVLSFSRKEIRPRHLVWIAVVIIGLIAISTWGMLRMRNRPISQYNSLRVSLIQSNLDQLHWGATSLDTSFAVTESLIYLAAKNKPDLLILPESALLCFLVKQKPLLIRVLDWVDSVKIPMILGALDWEATQDKPTGFNAYNTAFFFDTSATIPQHYYKIKLVPFSEAIPFEANIPLLSRVNLGEADFSRGTEATIFQIGQTLKAAPFICYEIIYPNFVRQRVLNGANLLVNITNDGWFGKTAGPFQHAAMAQMRAIENGVSLARCANSGISMFVNPFGKVQKSTRLYKRTILTDTIPLIHIQTLYCRLGDWPLFLSLVLIIPSFLLAFCSSNKKIQSIINHLIKSDKNADTIA